MTAPPARTTVRCLRDGDYAVLCALRDAVSLGKAVAPGMPSPAGGRRALTPDTFVSFVEGGCSYVIDVGDRLVGYLLGEPISFVDDKPLTVWVEEVAVHPDQQECPIATALYRALGAAAGAEGVQAVLTRIDAEDAAALELHRRVGFERHATGTSVWRLGAG